MFHTIGGCVYTKWSTLFHYIVLIGTSECLLVVEPIQMELIILLLFVVSYPTSLLLYLAS